MIRKFRSASISAILLSVCVVLFMASCAKKITFNTSSVVPAADADVSVKKDNNDNYAVRVEVVHLAPASRLNPPKEHYVVWIETEYNGIKNLGQLKSSSGFLSSTLKASLSTVTPFKPTKVFITAENDGNIQYPGPEVVLSTSKF